MERASRSAGEAVLNSAENSFDVEKELGRSSRVTLETFQQHLHSFHELQLQTLKDVNTVHSEINDMLNQSITDMENSRWSPLKAQMTSTPKKEDMDNNSSLLQFTDRRYTSLPMTDEMSDPEKSEKLHDSPANEERAENYHNSAYETLEFPLVPRSKHLHSMNSTELSSNEYQALPINADLQHNNSLKYKGDHDSEPKDPFVSFEHDDELAYLLKHQESFPLQLKGKHSDSEEIEFGHLKMTDTSTDANQPMGHAQDSLTKQTNAIHERIKTDVSSQGPSNVLLSKPQAENSRCSLYIECWATKKTEHLRHCERSFPYIECKESEATLEQLLDNKNTFKNYNNFEKQLKSLEDGNVAINTDQVFKIQDLESSLTKSDQLKIQEQRLRNETISVQKALKQQHINTQCLRSENLCYREEITKLRTDNTFLQLRLFKAEQDGEEYVQEIKTVTDKCEELLNQRKHIQDERNHLSVENQFLIKELEDLKKMMKKTIEQLASITIEKENLAKVLNSTKTKAFSYAREKQELQSKLTEVMMENSHLSRKVDGNGIQQVKKMK